MTADELLFFNPMPQALPLYQTIRDNLLSEFPHVTVKVQRTQITFRERYGFAFVSLRRMRGCPAVFLILTLGLGRRLDSPRVAAAAEPYPGRWTHHLVISQHSQLDGELMAWLREAHEFAQRK